MTQRVLPEWSKDELEYVEPDLRLCAASVMTYIANEVR